VLALNLVAELSSAGYAVHHATGSSAFTQTVRKLVGTRAAQQFNYFNSYLNAEDDELDVLICDEAHRIRRVLVEPVDQEAAEDPDRPQIDELLSVARVSVFFIDDLQAVRNNEIGDSGWIERQAELHGADVREHELEIQFRCGGSDGFVRWLENTLGSAGPRTPCGAATQLRVRHRRLPAGARRDDPLPRRRGAHRPAGRRLLLAVVEPDPDGQLVDDVQVDGWSRPWNARPNAGRLAPASRSRTCGPPSPAASTRSAASTPRRASSSTTSA
jgi:uncharacterized protein